MRWLVCGLQTSDRSRSTQWQAEFKRLKNLLVSIPKDSGYAPVAILVFWVPDDRPSSELRSRIAEVVRWVASIFSLIPYHIINRLDQCFVA